MQGCQRLLIRKQHLTSSGESTAWSKMVSPVLDAWVPIWSVTDLPDIGQAISLQFKMETSLALCSRIVVRIQLDDSSKTLSTVPGVGKHAQVAL